MHEKFPDPVSSIADLDKMSDAELQNLDWQNLNFLNARLLEMCRTGRLPEKPIGWVDQILEINDEKIVAEFTFAPEWRFDPNLDLTMGLQSQLEYLVGFWLLRDFSGFPRARSSGKSELLRPIKFEAGKKIQFKLTKKKCRLFQNLPIAIFDGEISDDSGAFLQTEKIKVALIDSNKIEATKIQQNAVSELPKPELSSQNLSPPSWDAESYRFFIKSAFATQKISADLWPFAFHLEGDPIYPANLGVHTLIEFLKYVARREFEMPSPIFASFESKKFRAPILPKNEPYFIRFSLEDIDSHGTNSLFARRARVALITEKRAPEFDIPLCQITNLQIKSRQIPVESLRDLTAAKVAQKTI